MLTTTGKLQLSARVSFLWQVKHLCIFQQINVYLSSCINDIKNNSANLCVSLGRLVGCTQKQTTPSHTSPQSLSFRPLSLYSLRKQPYRGRLLISEINIAQSYTSLNAKTEANSLALDGVGFTKRKGGESSPGTCTHSFLCVLFVQAVV